MQALASGLRWVWSNFDPIITFVLAVLFSLLGAFGVVNQQVLSNVVLATLAVIALTLVRERTGRGASSASLSASLERRLSALDHSIAEVKETIGLMDTLIKPTQGRFLSRDFERAVRDTRLWIYKGGTGTYLRAVVLPGNAENALRDRRPRSISIEILDPDDVELCDRYGRLRRSLDPSPDRAGEVWTTKRVRSEGYATILAAAYYQEQYGLLEIQLGLSKSMSLFRYDLSSNYIIITQEDGTAPALKADSGTYFYDSYLNELRLSYEQSRKIDLRRAQGISPTREQVTASEVCGLFQALGVVLDGSFQQEDVERIIQKALKPVNLYG